jgi:hypothetical protein
MASWPTACKSECTVATVLPPHEHLVSGVSGGRVPRGWQLARRGAVTVAAQLDL